MQKFILFVLCAICATNVLYAQSPSATPTNAVGINTTSPKATLDVNGSMAVKFTNLVYNLDFILPLNEFVDNYEIKPEDYVLLCKNTQTAFAGYPAAAAAVSTVLVFPNAASCAGRVIIVKRVAGTTTTSLIVQLFSLGGKIDGVDVGVRTFDKLKNIGTVLRINAVGAARTFMSDGTDWIAISKND